jgi:hypothetical protein
MKTFKEFRADRLEKQTNYIKANKWAEGLEENFEEVTVLAYKLYSRQFK